MRKLFLLLALVASIALMAQGNSSIVIRNGNTYVTEGTSMNKVEFCDFLKSQNSAAYQTFQQSLKLSKQGWALFGTGLGVELAGAVTWLASGAAAANVKNPDKTVFIGTNVGAALIVAGDCLTLSGIVCLGVGYGRMHRCVDIYNVEYQSKSNAQLRVNCTGNGLGLALAW